MTIRFSLLLFTLILGICSSHSEDLSVSTITKPATESNNEEYQAAMLSRGYSPLFNGKDLTDWWNPYSYGDAKVVDGEIHLSANKKFFLVTKKKYSDFRVTVEIHLPEGQANSGVMFRCQVDKNASRKVFGYQAECDGSDRRWSGGLFDESRRGWIWPSTKGRSLDQFLEHEIESKAAFADPVIANALNRNGWNRFVITCIQDRITIELNGVPTISLRDTTDASGYIAIQHHGEKGQTYRFRNLFIKELPDIPAEGTVTLTDQAPVSIKKIDDKNVLVDFGKVAFGNIAMNATQSGEPSGKIHFGEKLKNGRIDRHPPGTVRYGVSDLREASRHAARWIVPTPVNARNTEQTAVKGDHPPAVLTPKDWLPVMPFRWVEIEGWEGELRNDDIIRRAAFANEWNDDASAFECSDETLNRIWELCKYSIKATTFAGVYVDGDRERIPYEADAYLNQLSHYATDDNVKMAARTFDWLMENRTWPSEWAPHMVFMAYSEWMHSGDSDWLKHRYESLKAKTLLHRSGDDGLVRSDEHDQKKHDIVDWPQKERDGFVFMEINTVVNAFHIEALKRMAMMARAIGKNDEANAFDARVNLAQASFQKTLFDETAGIYRDGVGTDHSSVHANFFPLAFDLVPEDKIEGVLAWLKKKNMACSPYAAQYFMEALFQNESGDKALELITADGDRSWKHMANSGTTISWEAWDLKYKPNQDWNHAWGAAPANLLPRFVLGVQVAEPGWKSVLIRPCPGDLKYARGKVPTSRGTIQVEWKQDTTFAMSLKLPDGVTARLELPSEESMSGVFIDGKPSAATYQHGRWIVTNEVTGSIQLEIR